MDWPRYMRAIEAGRIEVIEAKRLDLIKGDIKEEKLSLADQKAIINQDHLYSLWMDWAEAPTGPIEAWLSEKAPDEP